MSATRRLRALRRRLPLRGVVNRVRAYAPSLLLAASAAGVAFLLASALFGTKNAVFAPIAAVVATGLAAGQRMRRAVEISAGVVVGLAAADLLSRWLGVGPLQLTLAVLVAMTIAVAARPSGLMANQAAVAAVVVMALAPYLDAGPWVRLGDALVGGVVAVALNAVAAPDPYRLARSVTATALGRLGDVLRKAARAVETGSLAGAEEALEDMNALDDARTDIAEALAATRERLAWRQVERRERRFAVRTVTSVASRVVIMLSTGRALCRAAANLVRHSDPRTEMRADGSTVASGHVEALDELVRAVEELQRWVTGSADAEDVRTWALRAATTASAQLPGSHASAVLVGQVRSAAVDLLRATGATQPQAVSAVEEAAGRADRLGG